MDELKYAYVLQAVMELPWAILPGKLAIIQDLLRFRMAGGVLSAEEVRERVGDGRAGEKEMRSGGVGALGGDNVVTGGSGVAVLPMVGTIIPRGNMLMESSGALSLQSFRKSFRAAMADPNVGSIVLDVDSPGGQVGGVEEMAKEIYDARGVKSVTAVVNTLAASAAYYIASAANEMVITPSGQAGSIGVYAMHEDVSVLYEQAGVKVNLISAGKYKVEGNPFEPLTEEARASIQTMVDGYYELFVNAVARNRGVKASEVRNGFGEGRVVGAKEAVQLGMVDRVGTLDEVVNKLASGGRRRRVGASLDFAQRRLRLERVSSETAVSVETGEL